MSSDLVSFGDRVQHLSTRVLKGVQEYLRVHKLPAAAAATLSVLVAALLIKRARDAAPLSSLLPVHHCIYDYIVVGAGSSGCVLARRLAEDPSVNVLLLEAGGSDVGVFNIDCPCAVGDLQRTEHDWELVTDEKGETGLGHRTVRWPRGKVLGGSSCLNYMLYVRGNKRDYDDWANMHGCEGWSYEDVLPHFKRSERRVCTSTNHKDQACDDAAVSAYHGRDGSLVVTDPSPIYESSAKFLEACVQSGIPYNPDYNGEEQEGCSVFQYNIDEKGKRCSSSAAFLRDNLPSNLTIRTHAHAQKIVFEDDRAVGVAYKHALPGTDVEQEVTHVVRAAREIILSAGAIGSPQLLLLSGVGPKEHLEEMGVPVVHDLPVGENMQDHLILPIAYNVKDFDGVMSKGNTDSFMNIARYIALGSGPLAKAPAEAQFITKTTPAATAPDLQLHFIPGGFDKEQMIHMMNVNEENHLAEHPTLAMLMCPTLLHPKSKGSIRLQSKNAFVPPRISPNYLDHPEDVRVMTEGYKIARKVCTEMNKLGFWNEEVPLEHSKHPIESDAYMLDYLRRKGTTVYHPTGTCRMGPVSDPRTVVDSALRVHGIKGLRVADCSIMPEIVSGNTNAPAIMIGEKAAELILHDKNNPSCHIPKASTSASSRMSPVVVRRSTMAHTSVSVTARM
eukprot:TRINITY_DN5107_c0_g2_i2.p1 TRINITY_DN5107_c0_g2~~TRINITY_DN5107_c0_g2_i2.p1  ORF type:complete len:673 (+),score=115.99 TRINITY_DN5107_c0_g2_i2:150-2168(+)